jgi:raffinose/stachyose/melibiose transport system permease protein
LWKYMGLMMIIFLAALQSISQEVLESSVIDGASPFQQLRHIILPSIWSIVTLCLFLNLNGTLGAYEFQFAIWTSGNTPLGMADTFVTKTYDLAFDFHNYGLASAMGIILVIIVGVLAIAQNKLVSREDK